jgi:Zinc dependent phospholipase C
MGYENTHLYVAEQIRLEVAPAKIKPLIESNLRYYYLGSIFPDTFSYSKKERIRSISGRLHGADGTPTNRAVFSALDRIKETRDPKSLAFIFGYLTHLALDATVHPVIYYFSGYIAHGSPVDHEKSIYLHWHYESHLDRRFNDRFWLDELVSVAAAKELGISGFMDIPESAMIKALTRQITYFSRVRSRFFFRLYRLMNKLGVVSKEYLAGFYPNLELEGSRLPEQLIYRDIISGEPKETTLEILMRNGIELGKEMIESAYDYYCGNLSRKECEKVVSGNNLDTGRPGKLVSDIRFSK